LFSARKGEQRKELVHAPAKVDLADVDHLLAAGNGNLLRVGLLRQGLEGGLDRVHGVVGPHELGRQVVDTDEAAHLKDAVRNAKAESCLPRLAVYTF